MEKRVYFVSDHHFGVETKSLSSREREDLFVRFLEEVRHDALEIIFMGDLFDFWFEYKTVVQKGYVRLLGKIAELTDTGIPISYFRGNHDLWAFSYLHDEVGMTLYRKPLIRQILGKTFFLAHGDGLGNGDNGYKFLKWLFENPVNQWFFRWVHPDFSTQIAFRWSRRSRYSNRSKGKKMQLRDGVSLTEWSAKKRLPDFCKTIVEESGAIDYFVFGHYHQPLQFDSTTGGEIITIGDWIVHFTYAVFDGEKLEIKHYINT